MTREWHTKPDVRAECLSCDWTCVASNAHAVGAQHARKHAHSVRVEKTTVFVYDHGGVYEVPR